jgi:hypothetical protein
MAFIASLRDVVAAKFWFSMTLTPVEQGTEMSEFCTETAAADGGKERRTL